MSHSTALLAYNWDWRIAFGHGAVEVLETGAKYTLIVSGLSLAFGNVVGVVAALMRMSRKFPFSWIAYIYIDFFRTTPALVQLIWIFYVLPIVLGISLSPITSGVIALSLNAGAFLAEVFRSGLESIGRGQHDAAYVLGLRTHQKWLRIIFPQAFRRVLPATGNVFIGLLKDSSLLSVVAVPELTYQTQTYVASTFRPLELYSMLAVAYFVLTYPLSLATSALERRYKVT